MATFRPHRIIQRRSPDAWASLLPIEARRVRSGHSSASIRDNRRVYVVTVAGSEGTCRQMGGVAADRLLDYDARCYGQTKPQ